MLHFTLKTTLFLFLLFLINAQGERLKSPGWENPEYFKKSAVFHNQQPCAFNTLFFGSSRTLRHVDPVVFDSMNALQQVETMSYNMASSAIFYNEQFFLFNEFFKDSACLRKLKYLFLELDNEIFIDKESVYSTRLSYYITPGNLGRILRQILASRQPPGIILTQVYYHISSMARHNMFMGQGPDYLKKVFPQNPNSIAARYPRGYRPTNVRSQEYYMSENLQLRRAVFLLDTQFIRHAFAYIDSMHQNPIQQGMYNPRVYNTYVEFITRMEKLGVHVICIVPMRRKITAELLSLYQALPEGHKIDMSAHPDIDLLGTARYWFDGGHLNSDGAEIYTRLLAESFANIAQ